MLLAFSAAQNVDFSVGGFLRDGAMWCNPPPSGECELPTAARGGCVEASWNSCVPYQRKDCRMISTVQGGLAVGLLTSSALALAGFANQQHPFTSPEHDSIGFPDSDTRSWSTLGREIKTVAVIGAGVRLHFSLLSA